jgi:Tol biopolymer transport system component
MAIVSQRNGLYILDLSDLSTQRLFTFAEVGASDIWYPRWSPDGKRIAVTMQQRDPDLYYIYSVLVVDVESMSTSVVTSGMDPAWSAAGDSIASILVKAIKHTHGITWYPDEFHVYSLTNNESVFTIQMENNRLSDLDWGPDGRSFLMVDEHDDALWIVVVRNEGRTVGPRIRVESIDCKSPRWSPDGKSIAWITEWCEEGKCGDEILIAQWDGYGISEETRITQDGGYKIGFAWSPDGQKLQYYILGQGLYSIDILSGKRGWLLRE